MVRRSIFTLGGTVQAGGGRYLPRQVDEELLALCRAGTFAFVLSARQMGKSSLMVRTAQRLAEEGTRSVIVDLTQVGVQVNPEAWYLGFITAIEDSLGLETAVYDWWEQHTYLGFTQRLTRFFQEVLPAEISEPVVIFIDEIDSTLSLPFTDDFFAAIRYVYNARSSHPAFKKLSFVLIGVATPIDLISDPTRTPFNIGQEVDVDYFTLEEAMPLADGFDCPREEARRALRGIVSWTGGHPYLTQRLCYVVAERYQDAVPEAEIEQAVAETFFGEKSEQDSNLRFVHDMLTRRAPDPLAVLTTYRQILLGRRILDDKQSPTITHLKLSGVVGRRSDRLAVRNPIYAAVFNRRWVKEQWPEAWYKRVPPAVIGLVAALFAAVLLLGLFLFQAEKTRQAQARTALQETLNAQLSDQIQVADSLRRVTEEEVEVSDSLRASELAVNVQLSDQIRVADSLRRVTEATNEQLSAQIRVADSLWQATEVANEQLSAQIRVVDSLRTIAEARLNEARRARLETLTIALASKALRQLKLGDAALGALLARQAFLFSQAGEGEFLDPVYDALIRTLNALGDGNTTAGGPDVLALNGAGVRAVAYSPDGRWVASASEDGAIMLWSPETGAVKRLDGHTASVRSLAFSPDGTWLASGGDDAALQLWYNLETPQPGRRRVGSHQGGVWAVAFAPDGKCLASAGADRVVTITDLDTRAEIGSLSLSGSGRVRTLAFSPKGERLAVGGEDGTLRLWTWAQPGRAPLAWNAGQGRLLALAFSPNGTRLASGGDHPTIRFWDIDPPEALPEAPPRLERSLRGHESSVNAVAFSPDGERFAAASSDHSVQVWRVSRLDNSPLLLQDHTAWVWSLAFSPDGTRLASGSADRTVRLWRIKPAHLAERICTAVQGRQLSQEEWTRYIGADFQYARDYEPCARRTTAENTTGFSHQP